MIIRNRRWNYPINLYIPTRYFFIVLKTGSSINTFQIIFITEKHNGKEIPFTLL